MTTASEKEGRRSSRAVEGKKKGHSRAPVKTKREREVDSVILVTSHQMRTLIKEEKGWSHLGNVERKEAIAFRAIKEKGLPNSSSQGKKKKGGKWPYLLFTCLGPSKAIALFFYRQAAAKRTGFLNPIPKTGRKKKEGDFAFGWS